MLLYSLLEASEKTTNVVKWISVGAILALFAVIFLIRLIGEKRYDAKRLAFAGICVAMSFTLALVKFKPVQYGGSITLASFVPILVYAYFYGAADVADVAAADHDVVTVTAPALGIAGKLHRHEGGVGIFERLVNGADLSCRARARADGAQCADFVGEIHFGAQSRVDGGDHQPDGVQHRAPHELGEGGGGVVNIAHRIPFSQCELDELLLVAFIIPQDLPIVKEQVKFLFYSRKFYYFLQPLDFFKKIC